MSEPIVVDLNQTESIDEPFLSDASYAHKEKPEIVALNEAAKLNRPDYLVEGSTQQREMAQANKEFNVASGSKYRVEYQDLLSDEKQRLEAGRWLSEKEFVRKLESILGHRVFVHDAGMPGMRGLFVKMRGMERFPYREDLPLGINYICGIRVPYMSEWSVLTPKLCAQIALVAVQ
jgi:hypothetical protein